MSRLIDHTLQFDDIIDVVKREHNQKRSFLFLNRYQAKYIPSNPNDTIVLFKRLAEQIKKQYENQKIVVIGFAETATAIGVVTAQVLGTSTYYIHTTREQYFQKKPLVIFEEEHSHASKHDLYCKDIEVLSSAELILLIDDELTTGKTVCNFVESLRQQQVVDKNAKFLVASIVNCMNPQNLQQLQQKQIDCMYLFHQQKHWDTWKWTKEYFSDTRPVAHIGDYRMLQIDGRIEIRQGSRICDYLKACDKLATLILQQCLLECDDQSVLVLGTEECMYPAIYTAQQLTKKYSHLTVVTHATSRSPILPMKQKDYPIKNRSVLPSFYERDRITYLYNLKQYHQVIIVTDSIEIPIQTIQACCSILRQYGNQKITIVQWREI